MRAPDENMISDMTRCPSNADQKKRHANIAKKQNSGPSFEESDFEWVDNRKGIIDRNMAVIPFSAALNSVRLNLCGVTEGEVRQEWSDGLCTVRSN